jgi:hypothetical protein
MAQGMFLGAYGDYGNQPIAQPKSKEQLAKEAANQFVLPNVSDLKFGGA